MATEKQYQDPFLAAIEAKIAAWTAVAESYRAATALDGPLAEGTAQGHGALSLRGQLGGSVNIDLPVGVFRDKSLKEAIPIYLAARRRKQTNKEIAIGLQAGGFPTTADNFEATVATALYRLKNEGIVLRFPDGWDLASSYPDNLRSRLEKESAPRKLRAKVAKRPRTRRAKAEGHSGRVLRIKRAKPESVPSAIDEDREEAV